MRSFARQAGYFIEISHNSTQNEDTISVINSNAIGFSDKRFPLFVRFRGLWIVHLKRHAIPVVVWNSLFHQIKKSNTDNRQFVYFPPNGIIDFVMCSWIRSTIQLTFRIKFDSHPPEHNSALWHYQKQMLLHVKFLLFMLIVLWHSSCNTISLYSSKFFFVLSLSLIFRDGILCLTSTLSTWIS